MKAHLPAVLVTLVVLGIVGNVTMLHDLFVPQSPRF